MAIGKITLQFHVSRSLFAEYLEKNCVKFTFHRLCFRLGDFVVILLSILLLFSSRHAAVKVGSKHLSTKRLRVDFWLLSKRYLPAKCVKMKFKQGRNNGGFAATNCLAIAGKFALKISLVLWSLQVTSGGVCLNYCLRLSCATSMRHDFTTDRVV